MQAGRDIQVIVDSIDSKRGTGKTVTSVGLALMLQKAASEVFGTQPLEAADFCTSTVDWLERWKFLVDAGRSKGATIVLDEGGVNLSSRDWQSRKNREFEECMQIMRKTQTNLILSIPNWHFLDTKIQSMCSARVMMVPRPVGASFCYSIHNNIKGQPVPRRLGGRLLWPDVSQHPAMQLLDDQKDALVDEKIHQLRGTGKMFTKEEHEKIVKEVKEETKNELLGRSIEEGFPATGLMKVHQIGKTKYYKKQKMVRGKGART
tara:strand:- start:90 stop:875 length:786 start_codon:yes stop_codon:yes gene_type:complete